VDVELRPPQLRCDLRDVLGVGDCGVARLAELLAERRECGVHRRARRRWGEVAAGRRFSRKSVYSVTHDTTPAALDIRLVGPTTVLLDRVLVLTAVQRLMLQL
jgi:hypothetical protein